MSGVVAGGSGGCRIRLAVVLDGFERFLANDKSVSTATVQCYLRQARPFLAAATAPDGVVDLGGMSPEWVRSYVTSLGGRYAPQSLRLIASAVRAFLRFAWMSGWTSRDLTGAVGPVVTRRSGLLPKALPVGDLRRLLTSPDRSTPIGIRDYALLLLLSRLGLRAGEVAGLRLDDFDWRAATVSPRVKGGARLRLPVPHDAGQAVTVYLRRRPKGTACREVFLRARGAPAPMTRGSVTMVVARHAARAGLGTTHAHRLRHSAARAILSAGGSLREVSELLGHATPQVSMSYASFDLASLTALVRAWPQEADDA